MLEPRQVDLNQLVTGMGGLLHRTLSERIEIQLVPAPELWLAEVDPGQLEAALLNLAINARDAMPEGGRLIIETANVRLDAAAVALMPEMQPGDYVLVSVTDTGIGMTAEVAARVFEPFFTTKGVGKGSGLGLPMVYGFVRQSRGNVRIYSEPGEGTTVSLYFPRANNLTPEGAESETAQLIVGGSEHILVVEDNPLVRHHVISLLQGLGYRISSAGSAPEALALLRQHSDFDLMFTDIVMPGGMSGHELALAARRLKPELRVLLTSGYSEQAVNSQGRLEGELQLLSKPYRRQELADKVRRILDGPAG
jgi:CheY-like chemotaxis protein